MEYVKCQIVGVSQLTYDKVYEILIDLPNGDIFMIRDDLGNLSTYTMTGTVDDWFKDVSTEYRRYKVINNILK